MKKIGILTCSNTTQELDCCSAGCLQSLNEGKGAFAAHQGEEMQVVGVISCAGCPTTIGPKKILKRLAVLDEIGANTLHLASCLTMLCPFKSKYRSVIQEAFPRLTIIDGTEAPEGDPADDAAQLFMGAMTDLIQQQPRNMAEVYRMLGKLQQNAARAGSAAAP